MAYYEGEISPIGNNSNNNGWNDWSWIIGLALVGGLFGGWGNGGFGFGGNRGGGIPENYSLATDFANLERKLDGINNGLCDGFYAQNTNMLNGFASVQSALCQGFNGLQQTSMQGFHGVDNAVCNLGYQTQAGFNALSSQVAQCCCDTRSAIADVKYANERNTCDIIRAGQDNTRAILDYLTGEKISSLQAENSGLKAQINNDRQSAYLVSQLREPTPIPAYYVPNPNCCYNSTGCGVAV